MADLIARARDLWTALAGSPVEFRDGRVRAAVSADSLVCPPGWIGLVVLDGAGIAVVPRPGLVDAVAWLPPGSATDPAFLRTGSGGPVRFPAFAEVLGPATLAFLDATEFRGATGPDIERLAAGHAELDVLLAAATPDEVGESGIDDIRSDVFVIRESGRVVAAAGYERWPGNAAHLCVLTAADARGRGLARAAASAAAEQALAEGLLPQWRAVPEPSRRIARALGFRELGAQLSVRPAG
jgi:hypothetical protein